MTAVISRQNPDRFTPEHRQDNDPRPVFLLAPLSWREKAAWQADLVRAGASRYPPDLAIIDAVRRAVLDLRPDNDADLLAAIEAFKEATIAREAGWGIPDEPVRLAYAAVEDRLRGHPEVALLLSERVMFSMLAPPLAAARALVGWENVGIPFERRGDLVPDSVLGQLSQEDLAAVGGRALMLMRPDEAEKKASESPSPSPDDPKISLLILDPEKHGHSTAKNTRRTQAN